MRGFFYICLIMEIKIITRILVLSYFMVVFIFPSVSGLDIDTWRLFLFSTINTISLGVIFFNNELFQTFFNFLKSKISIVIILFIIWSLTSYFYALNGNEVIIRSMDFVNFLITLLVLYTFISFNRPSPYQISVVMLINVCVLASASYISLYDITRYFEYNFDLNNRLMGIFPNRNITQAVYLIHLPFILYVLSNSKSISMKILSGFSAVLLVNIVYLMGARTSYVIFFFLALTLLIVYFRNKDLRKYVKNYFAVFITASILSTVILGPNNSAFIVNRASTIDFQEESSATRLRYYKYGLNEFFSNPFIGIGTGNWKIKSVGLDKDYIRSYVIPYTMHNDFLEVAVELGIIGLTLFSLIFYYSIINLWALYQKNKSKEFILIIPLALLIYLIDSMINFPFTRASQLFYLSALIALSHYFIISRNENIS